mmetsp:Transcript_83420/g.232212  ORF Transcript_83420/g.232212 Transcript_83420/m.232212 type:complete len:713 (-) Transcript_83420:102-2240(-)
MICEIISASKASAQGSPSCHVTLRGTKDFEELRKKAYQPNKVGLDDVTHSLLDSLMAGPLISADPENSLERTTWLRTHDRRFRIRLNVMESEAEHLMDLVVGTPTLARHFRKYPESLLTRIYGYVELAFPEQPRWSLAWRPLRAVLMADPTYGLDAQNEERALDTYSELTLKVEKAEPGADPEPDADTEDTQLAVPAQDRDDRMEYESEAEDAEVKETPLFNLERGGMLKADPEECGTVNQAAKMDAAFLARHKLAGSKLVVSMARSHGGDTDDEPSCGDDIGEPFCIKAQGALYTVAIIDYLHDYRSVTRRMGRVFQKQTRVVQRFKERLIDFARDVCDSNPGARSDFASMAAEASLERKEDNTMMYVLFGGGALLILIMGGIGVFLCSGGKGRPRQGAASRQHDLQPQPQPHCGAQQRSMVAPGSMGMVPLAPGQPYAWQAAPQMQPSGAWAPPQPQLGYGADGQGFQPFPGGFQVAPHPWPTTPTSQTSPPMYATGAPGAGFGPGTAPGTYDINVVPSPAGESYFIGDRPEAAPGAWGPRAQRSTWRGMPVDVETFGAPARTPRQATAASLDAPSEDAGEYDAARRRLEAEAPGIAGDDRFVGRLSSMGDPAPGADWRPLASEARGDEALGSVGAAASVAGPDPPHGVGDSGFGASSGPSAFGEGSADGPAMDFAFSEGVRPPGGHVAPLSSAMAGAEGLQSDGSKVWL